MDWRREDWGYAAATLVAAAFVCYLVAGNFGLVRTPFGPSIADGSASVPILAARERRLDSPPVPGSPAITPAPTDPATHSPTAGDEAPPTAVITAGTGTSVSATQGSQVAGTASDAGSGIDKVAVTFTPQTGDPVMVPATVSCRDASKRNCTWTADVPGLAGSYEATARAADRSGNRSTSEPKTVTVLNLGSLIPDAEERGLLDAVVRLLG